MEIKIIKLVLIIICSIIFFRGILYPLITLISLLGTKLVQWFLWLLEKSPLEKQKEALKEAKERVRIAELQKETFELENRALKINDYIIYEGLEELEKDEKHKKSKL